MKKVFTQLFVIFIFSLIACDLEKEIDIDNEWIAASIKLENGDFMTPTSNYNFILENNNQFSLQLDINRCGGNVYFKTKTVEFKNGIACTKACCDSEFAIALVTNISTSKKWEIISNQLIFTNDAGLKIIFEKK
ncbi:hypothetical protein [Polaribacter sp.]|jgi:heat shock protein HslJ|uniref:hypothetical protein n=1 Tax=Polaribacter sp. TaxID=1920175 RepID=UPI0007131A0E|nr:MAG: hypothetical protein ABS28_05985 [Cryomorphaceae bacterium BACL22 MAG-120619-bin32]